MFTFATGPNAQAGDAKQEIAVGELVISSGDAAKMLDAIEEALDQVARTVQRTVSCDSNAAHDSASRRRSQMSAAWRPAHALVLEVSPPEPLR